VAVSVPCQGDITLRSSLRFAIAALAVLVIAGVVVLITSHPSAGGVRGDDSMNVAEAAEAPSPTEPPPEVTTTTTSIDYEALGRYLAAVKAAAEVPKPQPPKVPKPKPVPVPQADPPPPSLGRMPPFLVCVAKYESGSSYTSHAPNGDGGMYGILVSTWHGLGYSGVPWQADPSQQDEAALRLYQSLGTLPWSTRHLCGG
jgi:hypothetical protein